MIVVADTSVVLNLCRVRQEILLLDLFQKVLIPEEVAAEFKRLAASERRFSGMNLPAWLQVEPPPRLIPPAVLRAQLDRGETAALALCVELRADALLIDEARGRRVARELGLKTVGVLGVLLQAKRAGRIPSVSHILDQLDADAGFWVGPEMRATVLDLAGEAG